MVLRKMFGDAFAGEALTNKAITDSATRETDDIHQYIAEMTTVDSLAQLFFYVFCVLIAHVSIV